MSMSGLVKWAMLAGGLLVICASPGVSQEQTGPPPEARPPGVRSPSAGARNYTIPPDVFEGLTLTDDQKTKIKEIRQESKSHLDALANDQKLSPEVKDAMVSGYHRIENGKIFAVLTPEQQREVRARVSAWRAEARQHQPQLKQPPPTGNKPQSK